MCLKKLASPSFFMSEFSAEGKLKLQKIVPVEQGEGCQNFRLLDYRENATKKVEEELYRAGFRHSTCISYRYWFVAFYEYSVSIRQKDPKVDIGFLMHEFLRDLRDKRLSSATRAQARAALKFLQRSVFTEVVPIELPKVRIINAPSSVLESHDVIKVLSAVPGQYRLLLELIFGCGLRVSEGVSLLIKDIDIKRGVLHIVNAKGGKNRDIPLPRFLIPPLTEHLKNLRDDYRSVDDKSDSSECSLWWRPEGRVSIRTIQRVVKSAASAAGIDVAVTPHTLRHSYATALLDEGVDIRFIQELLGHVDIRTTVRYTHVKMERLLKLPNPLDNYFKRKKEMDL